MPSPNKRVNLTLKEDLYNSIKDLSEASGMPIASLITHLLSGASHVFPLMVDVINKKRSLDDQKTIMLQNLISDALAPSSTQGARASEHAQAGAADNNPPCSNRGVVLVNQGKIVH